ncbi:MAG: amidohydrolase family protein [Chloroflexota bacterium]
MRSRAGALGLPIVDHPEDHSLTEGAEASEGYTATVLGLKGWPIAAEVGSVARSIAILEDVVRDVLGARLHLTHVSTAASLAHVRAAKAAGLPVTCDVTPHHLAFADEWIAGARRWAWEANDAEGRARDPWADGALVVGPYDTSLRVNPPLRSAEDAAACRAALRDGTADAIATDHAPHTEVDKHVEFGWAINGISGIETALSVGAGGGRGGRAAPARAVTLLTTGPAAVLGERGVAPGLREGAPADLVVVDAGASWTATPGALASARLLLGREPPGVVRLVIAGGRVAYDAG